MKRAIFICFIFYVAFLYPAFAYEKLEHADEQDFGAKWSNSDPYQGYPAKTTFRYAHAMCAAAYLARDWKQTRLISRSPHLYEMNPVLGRHPSEARVNYTFFADSIFMFFAIRSLPEPWSTSLSDSIMYTEKLVTEQNDLLFERKANPNTIPIGIVYTIQF